MSLGTDQWQVLGDGSPSQSLPVTGETTFIPVCEYPLWFRCFEKLLALLGLLIGLPLMLVEALIIWMGSPGPVLFVQNRMTTNMKVFRFVKFRTLYADAKERFPEYYEYQYTPEQLVTLKYKAEDDPRVTPQGRWFRRTSIDELPNFWHVLTGDMALVGPRPEIPEMLPYYSSEMRKKFTVRPGVTGLAQVSGRSRLTFYETVKYDVEYVNKKSVLLDLKIILRTVKLMFTSSGGF